MTAQTEQDDKQIIPWEPVYNNLVDDIKWQDAWRIIHNSQDKKEIIKAVCEIENCAYKATADIYESGMELERLEREHGIA